MIALKDDLHMLEAAVAKSLVEDTARRFAGWQGSIRYS